MDFSRSHPNTKDPDSPSTAEGLTPALHHIAAPSPQKIPEQIGEYAIKRVIASGGMGVVYEAVQDNPVRSVALKVMKQGLASRSAMRRFEFESQILGRLRHPCIAQVYDAGMHDDGAGAVPYFVMEYIPSAMTLTEFAGRLRTREKLDLLSRVCEGVHHGHQKGIIHRDLKPANILVDLSGEPKIIDFGVARVTNADLGMTTMQTGVGQLVGTLQYMSPEQIEGDPNDLDVRSDVYSLGVILYEMLTGRPPYNVHNRTVVEASRMVREHSPASLSSIDHALRGDVETITFTALQKEREVRYQSALEFSHDIQRYLNNEPISARRPSLPYQIRVFARRNKAAFAAIVTIVLISVVAAVVSGLFARQTITASDAMKVALLRAQEEADASKAAGNFMRDVLALASPQRALGREITVRQALDIAALNITAGTAGQPLAEASARAAVGSTYRTLGLYQQAADHLSRAVEIRKKERGPENPETLAIITELAGVLGDLNRNDEAAAMLRENLETQRRVLGEMNMDTLRTTNGLAWLSYSQGRYAEAESLFRRSADGFALVAGRHAPITLKARTNIAMVLADQGRADEAEELAEQAVSDHVRMLGQKNPDTLYAKNILAWTLVAGGRRDLAEPIYRKVVADATEVMGADHPYRLYWMNSYAWCLLDQGKAAEAEPLFVELTTKRESVLAEGHPDTFSSALGWVKSLIALKKFDQAAPLALKWRTAAVTRYGEQASIARSLNAALVALYEGWGKSEEAAKYRAAEGESAAP